MTENDLEQVEAEEKIEKKETNIVKSKSPDQEPTTNQNADNSDEVNNI